MSTDTASAPPRGDGAGPDRSPPHDRVAEQSVLGGMMLSKDAVADVIELVKAADFYLPAHAILFTAITDLYAEGEPVDSVTVAARLMRDGTLARIDGGAAYLQTCINTVPTAANAPRPTTARRNSPCSAA